MTETFYQSFKELFYEDSKAFFAEADRRTDRERLYLYLYIRMAADLYPAFVEKGISGKVYVDTFYDITIWYNPVSYTHLDVYKRQDWFSGMIYMNNPDNYPLQTYLQSLLQNFEQLLRTQSSQDIQALLAQMDARTGRAAQLFLGAIPVMVIYPFLQKYFTKGLVLGSVKG